MTIKLEKNAYGKNDIHLSKIIRHPTDHEFRQISVNVSLEGDFDTAHTEGDNSKILPTDTQKNTVYALAGEHFTSSIEAFGMYLADFFCSRNPQVSRATIAITEHLYQQMLVEGKPHPHAYISSGNEKRTAIIVQEAASVRVTSGIKDVLILKTTDSGFEHYIKDAFTTLPETADRILATQCDVSWTYARTDLDFAVQHAAIRTRLLQTFACHKSLSVQQTLYAMGEAVLQQHEAVQQISLKMPNRHHIPFNLEPFGMENKNEIFIATEAPFGYITGTMGRE